ncbi:MAG TPA: phosphopentomutase, partial [Syntrophomonadaceae bacterium]|nr:phosphopentomutase [Syntrophomonadaceae bacterium]
ISAAGLPVIGVGKIYDIFAGKGISRSLPSKNNDEGINQVLRAMEEEERGLIFVNLLDFDQQYGHRNDPQGYAQALEQFDRRLQEVIDKLRSEDMLCISADHGCDPTTPSTDHSREYVPLLVYGEKLRQNVNLGTRQSFADLGQTIAEYLDVKTKNTTGESFYPLIR